jgi:hypothetical protein
MLHLMPDDPVAGNFVISSRDHPGENAPPTITGKSAWRAYSAMCFWLLELGVRGGVKDSSTVASLDWGDR